MSVQQALSDKKVGLCVVQFLLTGARKAQARFDSGETGPGWTSPAALREAYEAVRLARLAWAVQRRAAWHPVGPTDDVSDVD